MNDWLFFILAWIIGIPTGIFINLITPSIDAYLKKRYLSVRERQKYILINRYKEVKNFAKHPIFKFEIPDYIKLWIFPLAALIIFSLMENSYKEEFGDFYNLFSAFVLIFTYPLSLYVNIRMFRDLFMLRDWTNFYEYRASVIKKLVKLGGNPEELDVIDKEIEAQ